MVCLDYFGAVADNGLAGFMSSCLHTSTQKHGSGRVLETDLAHPVSASSQRSQLGIILRALSKSSKAYQAWILTFCAGS